MPYDDLIEDLPPWIADWTEVDESLMPWTGQKALREILNQTREGVVCDVVFDLAHPDMPSVEHWHAPSGHLPYGIAFPWDRAVHGGDLAQTELEVTGGGSTRGWGTTHVFEGDVVSVANVSRLYRDSRAASFTDDHNAYQYEVSLRVTKPDGSAHVAESSIAFVSRDAMGPHLEATLPNDDDDGYRAFLESFVITFQKVSLRIARLRANDPNHNAREWLDFAAEAQALALEDFEALEGTLADGFWKPDAMLDAAAAAGYALAKAEAEAILPLAKKGAKARESQMAATNAARKRADPVRSLAIQLIKDNAQISQGQCARHVAAALERDQRAVERVIGPLFEFRDLPGGGREKRPLRHLTTPRRSGG